MEVNRYDTAKIWRLIEQWIESVPDPVLATPATVEAKAAESTAHAEHYKTPAVTRSRAKSRTSPSNPFQHLHLNEGHTSRQSSPLVTSQVISEADVADRPAPLNLPQPRLQSIEQEASNNVDLVGSDTSAGSSVPDSLSAEKSMNSSSSDEMEVPGAGPLTARRFSDDKMLEMQAGLAASLPAHLVMKRRPTLSTVPQQASGASSRTVTRSSSSANNTIAGDGLSMPRSTSRQIGKTLPETGTIKNGRSTRAFSNNSVEAPIEGSRAGSKWNLKKDPVESSASEVSDPSETEEDEQAEARRLRRFKVHNQRSKARQGRSKSRRRGAGSPDEKPRRTVSGRQSRSVSATRRVQRSMSKIRTEALLANVSKIQDEVKDMLNSKFGEQLHEIMQQLADDVGGFPSLSRPTAAEILTTKQGDVQASATIACAVRDKIDVKPQFLARISTAYLCKFGLYGHFG